MLIGSAAAFLKPEYLGEGKNIKFNLVKIKKGVEKIK